MLLLNVWNLKFLVDWIGLDWIGFSIIFYKIDIHPKPHLTLLKCAPCLAPKQ